MIYTEHLSSPFTPSVLHFFDLFFSLFNLYFSTLRSFPSTPPAKNIFVIRTEVKNFLFILFSCNRISFWMRFKRTSAQYLIFKTYIIYLKLRLLSHCLGSLNTQNHGPVEEVSRVESESLDHGERERLSRARYRCYTSSKSFSSHRQDHHSLEPPHSLHKSLRSFFFLSRQKLCFFFGLRII